MIVPPLYLYVCFFCNLPGKHAKMATTTRVTKAENSFLLGLYWGDGDKGLGLLRLLGKIKTNCKNETF